MISGLAGTPHEQCSRAGCRDGAEYRVSWRNPKIHGNDRVKVWLACAEHSEFLREYLSQRGFPTMLTPYDVEVDADQLTQVADRGSRS